MRVDRDVNCLYQEGARPLMTSACDEQGENTQGLEIVALRIE